MPKICLRDWRKTRANYFYLLRVSEFLAPLIFVLLSFNGVLNIKRYTGKELLSYFYLENYHTKT